MVNMLVPGEYASKDEVDEVLDLIEIDQELEFPNTEKQYTECIIVCTPLKIVSHEEFKKCFKKCFEKKLDEVIG